MSLRQVVWSSANTHIASQHRDPTMWWGIRDARPTATGRSGALHEQFQRHRSVMADILQYSSRRKVGRRQLEWLMRQRHLPTFGLTWSHLPTLRLGMAPCFFLFIFHVTMNPLNPEPYLPSPESSSPNLPTLCLAEAMTGMFWKFYLAAKTTEYS